MNRQRAQIDYNALKTAAKRALVDVGGIDAAASCTRGTRSLFSEYGSVGSDRFMPIDAVLDLETIGGTPHITAALASAQGFRLERIDPRPRDEVAAALARIASSMGTLFATASDALSDGIVTQAEALRLGRDLETTSRLVLEAMALLRAGPDDDADRPLLREVAR